MYSKVIDNTREGIIVEVFTSFLLASSCRTYLCKKRMTGLVASEVLPLIKAELATSIGPWLADSSASLRRLDTRLAVRTCVCPWGSGRCAVVWCAGQCVDSADTPCICLFAQVGRFLVGGVTKAGRHCVSFT